MSLFLKQLRDLRIPNPFGGSGSSILTVETGITALGTNQATAYQLTKNVSILSGGVNNSGVILPDLPIGSLIVVVDEAGGAGQFIYPPSGKQIDTLAVNDPVSSGDEKSYTFVRVTASRYISLSEKQLYAPD